MGILGNYVDDVRKAIVDTVILARIQQGTTTVDEVTRDVRGLGIDLGDLDVGSRISHLDRNGHLRKDGNNLALTDDGREDIMKVQPWFGTVQQRIGTAGTMTPGAGTRR